MKDRSKLKKLLAMAGEIHSKPITPVLTAVFWKALEPLSDAEADIVFADVISKSEFFPTPGTVLRRFEALKDQKGMKAWATLLKSLRNHGRYDHVNFTDGSITATVRAIGGMAALRNIPEKELQWKRKEFLDMYRQIEPTNPEPDVIRGLGEYREEMVIMIESEKEGRLLLE